MLRPHREDERIAEIRMLAEAVVMHCYAAPRGGVSVGVTGHGGHLEHPAIRLCR
jgi:hypothetical protein